MAFFRKIPAPLAKTTFTATFAAAAGAAPGQSAEAPRTRPAPPANAPGGIRVLAFMGGDTAHNAIPMEVHFRDIFATKKDWRITFVRSAQFFTPKLIGAADILVMSRGSEPDPVAWSGVGLADTLTAGGTVWTEENIRAIQRGVRERGMGFLALHDTIACGNRDMEEFLDIVPAPANELQPLWVRDLNGEHPVSRGFGPFLISLDEQFVAVVKSPETVTLFETTAIHDKRHAIGGWCLERGRGRVVGLLPGHGAWAYRTPEYREILWRSVHWALRNEIPPFPAVRG